MRRISASVKSMAATINLPHARAPISLEPAMVYAALQLMVLGGGAAGRLTDVYGDDRSTRGPPCLPAFAGCRGLPAARQLRARQIRQPIRSEIRRVLQSACGRF